MTCGQGMHSQWPRILIWIPFRFFPLDQPNCLCCIDGPDQFGQWGDHKECGNISFPIFTRIRSIIRCTQSHNTKIGYIRRQPGRSPNGQPISYTPAEVRPRRGSLWSRWQAPEKYVANFISHPIMNDPRIKPGNICSTLAGLAPFVLRGACPKCTPGETRQIQKTLAHIQRTYPKEWARLVQTYAGWGGK